MPLPDLILLDPPDGGATQAPSPVELQTMNDAFALTRRLDTIADLDIFWQELVKGVNRLFSAQACIVSRRLDINGDASIPTLGEPDSLLFGIACHLWQILPSGAEELRPKEPLPSNGHNSEGKPSLGASTAPMADNGPQGHSDTPALHDTVHTTETMHRDFMFFGFDGPCSLMRHGKLLVLPSGMAHYFPQDPNMYKSASIPCPEPLEACMGVPIFVNGANVGHILVCWSARGLALPVAQSVSWTQRGLVLLALAELASPRMSKLEFPLETCLHVQRELTQARRGTDGGDLDHLYNFCSKFDLIQSLQARLKAHVQEHVDTVPGEDTSVVNPLVSSLSHEIRTPLQGILGLTEHLYTSIKALKSRRSDVSLPRGAPEDGGSPNAATPSSYALVDANVENILETIHSSGAHLLDVVTNVHHALEIPAAVGEGNGLKRHRAHDEVADAPDGAKKLRKRPQHVTQENCIWVHRVLTDVLESYITRFAGTLRFDDRLADYRSWRSNDSTIAVFSVKSRDGKRLSMKKVELSFAPDLPVRARVNEQVLRMILSRVLSNAFKFSSDDGDITVRAGLLPASAGAPPAKAEGGGDGEDGNEEGRTSIQICVADRGPGVKSSSIPYLFSAFESADVSRTRKHDGAGLGLALSQKWARELGGDVWLESTVPQGQGDDHGSVFAVCLPCVKCTDCACAGPLGTGLELSTDRPAMEHAAPFRIMVVEDNSIVRRLAAAMLKQLGYASEMIALCENGQDAVETFARAAEQSSGGQSPFALILMDIWMPLLDGFEATRRIMALADGGGQSRPYVVAITADSAKDNLDRTAMCGMQGCVRALCGYGVLTDRF